VTGGGYQKAKFLELLFKQQNQKPMKFRNHILSSILVMMLITLSCSPKQEKAANQNDEWPEMDAFHMTMAEAFHPLKDSGNVEPAIRLIDHLVNDVDKWASSSIPDKVNNDEMKSKLEKLKADIHALAEVIQDGAPEDQIGTTMHTLHDQFHEIMEAWHSSDAEGEHDEKHQH
jgi:hypothetical protein